MIEEKEKSELDVLDPKGDEIVIKGRIYKIRPLVFRKYRKMAEKIAKIIEVILEDIPDIDISESIAKQAAPAFPKILDEILGVLAIALDVEVDFLDENLTMLTATEAIIKVIEVNGLDKILENFSKIAPMLKPAVKK